MTDSDNAEFESKLAFLERHVEAQDAEIWRLTQRVDQLAKLLKQQSEQINALNERGSGEAGSPADEKPPHY